MRKLLLFISMIAAGCANYKQKQASVAHNDEQAMAGWIKEQNDKHEKCSSEGWMGTEGNGYDTLEKDCKDGFVVWTDTTEETQQFLAKAQERKSALIDAARSRLLTPSETQELLDYGPDIFTQPMVPYLQADIDKRFDELLLQQARLKALTVRPEH
jgi:hypothetical protein